MKIEQHVLFAIDDYAAGKRDAALMHATFAIDATSRKLFAKTRSGRKEYKDCLRSYYWLIEPMMGGGINFAQTKWTNLRIDDGHGKSVSEPDLADVIYHIFRCASAHADEVSTNFELLPVEDGHSKWIMVDNVLKMPERIIWALLAVAVFCEANGDLVTTTPHYLTWGSETLGIGTHTFPISEYWGKEAAIRIFFEAHPPIRVGIRGLDGVNLQGNAILAEGVK